VCGKDGQCGIICAAFSHRTHAWIQLNGRLLTDVAGSQIIDMLIALHTPAGSKALRAHPPMLCLYCRTQRDQHEPFAVQVLQQCSGIIGSGLCQVGLPQDVVGMEACLAFGLAMSRWSTLCLQPGQKQVRVSCAAIRRLGHPMQYDPFTQSSDC
jgi:hypothetical protein